VETRSSRDGSEAQGNGHNIYLVVRDNGYGIPENLIEKIFQPFFTTKSEGDGTGLGLCICKQIVEDHNGTIGVSSHENVGTEFCVQLPGIHRDPDVGEMTN